MKSEKIALMPRQLVSIGLLVALPFLASAAGVAALTGRSSLMSPSPSLSIVLSVLCVLIAGAIVLAMVTRRSIELTPDKLTVKHSFYTFAVEHSSAKSAQVKRLGGRREIAISTKRNGVAAFGFYSGWFSAAGGKTCFCAVSALPVYAVSFPDNATCPLLAVSCSAEMADAIQCWAKG